MAHSPTSRNHHVDGGAQFARWVSIHTGDPGTTGANEVPGSTRAQTTYPAAVSGSTTGSPVEILVPAGGPYTHWGTWDASSGGNFQTGGALPAPETYGAPGVYVATPTLSA